MCNRGIHKGASNETGKLNESYDPQRHQVWLGIRLAALREEKGWNQSYLAELAGVGRAHLSQIENGSVSVCIDTLDALAKSLEISLSTLFRNI